MNFPYFPLTILVIKWRTKSPKIERLRMIKVVRKTADALLFKRIKIFLRREERRPFLVNIPCNALQSSLRYKMLICILFPCQGYMSPPGIARCMWSYVQPQDRSSRLENEEPESELRPRVGDSGGEGDTPSPPLSFFSTSSP